MVLSGVAACVLTSGPITTEEIAMAILACIVVGVAVLGYVGYRLSKVRFCLHHDGTALQEQADQKGLKR